MTECLFARLKVIGSTRASRDPGRIHRSDVVAVPSAYDAHVVEPVGEHVEAHAIVTQKLDNKI